VVFVVSVIPDGPDFAGGRLDKAAHVCEYLLFAWLLVQAFRASPAKEGGQALDRLRVWLYATSYGGWIELIQLLLPWRSAEWGDVVANGVGAALGVWLSRKVPRVNKPVVQ